MATYDDPVFVKALKLLHSPAKDSTLQIMHLLQEAMEQKYGGTKSLNMKFHVMSEDSSTSLDVPKPRGSRGASPALPGLSEKSSRSSTPPSEPVSLRTSPDRDDDEDLTLRIFEDTLCSVCKGVGFKSDNRLLECTGCLLLYHQGCHKPPVDNDSWDQNLGWTCGSCTKKSQEKQPRSKGSDSSSSKSKSDYDTHSESSSRKHKNDSDSSTAEPPSKKQKTDGEKSEKGHKKSEKGHSSKSHSSKSSSSSRSDSKSKSSSSNLNFNKAPGSPNGKNPSCTAHIIAADRRLQNMKKKAAAKILEKRSNPK